MGAFFGEVLLLFRLNEVNSGGVFFDGFRTGNFGRHAVIKGLFFRRCSEKVIRLLRYFFSND